MTPTRVIFLLLFVIFDDFASGNDRAALLNGVRELPASGSPGGISVISPKAFAVVAGKDGKSLMAVVAATHWEQGRIVAFSHTGYPGMVHDPSAAQLLRNAVLWTTGMEKPRVGVCGYHSLSEYLTSQGFEVTTLESRDGFTNLPKLDAICVNAHDLRSPDDVAALAEFVKRGGGLITAATGWGWASLNDGKSLSSDFLGNRLLAPSGLVFNDLSAGRTSESGYTVSDAGLDLLNATHALEALTSHQAGRDTLSKPDLTQAGATISRAVQALPEDDTNFTPRIGSIVKTIGGYVHPMPDKPLGADQPLARLLVAYAHQSLKRAAPEKVRVHPAAAGFPGFVPGDALVENRILTIDTARPGWHTTGLYAAPGALIRVTLAEPPPAKGFRVRIGCHKDSLWHLDEWKRVPEITVSLPLNDRETRIASAFGGLIYIEVPDKTSGFPLSVTVEGGVGAPHYVLGKTTPQDWLKQRVKPGPWAEIDCGRVILTVPSEHIRTLPDPTPVARFWDRVVELQDELAAVGHLRRRPERIVADVQISAGYMHSGYPIMTHLDVAAMTVDLARMQAGSWGHFHELGHNQQVRDWTFEGTVEVTCNIFSLYIMEKLCGKPPGQGHDSMQPDRVARRFQQHIRGDASAKWERWKNDPFLALTMYHQLRMGFGWDAYQKVFAEYRDLDASERPRTEQARRDQWMVRLSRTVGRNLGPFFEAWGVPVTGDAREQISSLPIWMPDDWPKS